MTNSPIINSYTSASRYHDISCGHVVWGHESKCQHLHGHNYRVHFQVSGERDALGRVLDFGVIKEKLCMWLETEWDHRFLIWDQHPVANALVALDPQGVLCLPFNPTAENMARHLLEIIGPKQLAGLPVTLSRVVVEETAKCSAEAGLWVPQAGQR
ncbi:MAG: 6-carboxytetrahydropterin synthase [Betaproteobacteria bacterium]|nr:6-carboxytetrahydropterin synthase [Betaproteobacteria bacterium]